MFSSQNNNKKKFPFIDNLESYKKTTDYNDFYKERGIENLDDSQKKEKSRKKLNFNLFNYQQYYEKELVKKQIKELSQLIKNEIENIKKTNKVLLSQIKDIANLNINDNIEKPGIYHVRFFEIILRILKQLTAKINESNSWLAALLTRKKKRGSLFAIRSKKLGTQYSLSQELQSTRSIQ